MQNSDLCALISIYGIFFLYSLAKKDIKSYWTHQCKEVHTEKLTSSYFRCLFLLPWNFQKGSEKFSCGCSHIFWSTYTHIIRTTSSESRCQEKSQVVATVVFCSLHCQVLWLTSHSCFGANVDIFCKTQNWNNTLLGMTLALHKPSISSQHYEKPK